MKPKLLSSLLALLLSSTLLCNAGHVQGATLPIQPPGEAPLPSPDYKNSIVLTERDSLENGVYSISVLKGKQIDIRLHDILITNSNRDFQTKIWQYDYQVDAQGWDSFNLLEENSRILLLNLKGETRAPHDFFFTESPEGGSSTLYFKRNDNKTATFKITIVENDGSDPVHPDPKTTYLDPNQSKLDYPIY